MKFGVVGDAVNLCSRVENLNKNYGTYLLVTSETEKLIRKKYSNCPLLFAHIVLEFTVDLLIGLQSKAATLQLIYLKFLEIGSTCLSTI